VANKVFVIKYAILPENYKNTIILFQISILVILVLLIITLESTPTGSFITCLKLSTENLDKLIWNTNTDCKRKFIEPCFFLIQHPINYF